MMSFANNIFYNRLMILIGIIGTMGIMILTYLVIGIYLMIIKVDKPWINAIVPVLGFGLSTLTVSAVKKIWVKYFIKIYKPKA